MIYRPLRDDEVLPVRKHRQVAMAPAEDDEEQEVSTELLDYHTNEQVDQLFFVAPSFIHWGVPLTNLQIYKQRCRF